jgi:serine/threonine-protein kinase
MSQARDPKAVSIRPPGSGVGVSPHAPTIGFGTEPSPSDTSPSVGSRQSWASRYIGTTIDGRYVVERVIGEGGMGVVYAGHHKTIGKPVAIKVLRREIAADDDANRRLLREARAASVVGNPHIVDISDFGDLPDGSTYFVMEYLAGQSLRSLLRESRGPIGVPRICHIAKQIAEGLAAAHGAGIVHRDLKPENVMLVDHGSEKDFVKIVDFGVAKVGDISEKITRAGSVFGTPHYMSPEQAAGTGVDHRTDIYALGVILYEMASRRVPFDAENLMGILTQHLYKAPVPIRTLVPESNLPAGLDAIVLKCLTKRPEGRYATMDDLVADLQRLEDGIVPQAVDDMGHRPEAFSSPVDYFPSPIPSAPGGELPVAQRWPIVAAVGISATLAGLLGVMAISWNFHRAAAASPPATAPMMSSVALLDPPNSVAPASAGPAMKSVEVHVVPGDAHISRDGVDLGGSPVEIALAEGESATLVVTRTGYKPKNVRVESGDGVQSVTLEIAAAPRATARASSRVTAKPGDGFDEVADPFAAPK